MSHAQTKLSNPFSAYSKIGECIKNKKLNLSLSGHVKLNALQEIGTQAITPRLVVL
jgi:hypothetical protein